jgi:hypothetical protein
MVGNDLMCDIPTIVPAIPRLAVRDAPGRGSGVRKATIELVLRKIAYRVREVVPAGSAVVRTTAATAMDMVVVVDATHGPTASASMLYEF